MPNPIKKSLFILALDGTPYSFLKKMITTGLMPNLTSLVQTADLRPMNSVLPTVSSVAWSSFLTGLNPAQHGIFGFIERNPGTMDVYVPTGTNLHGLTIPEHLSDSGRRVFCMNVPITYPPRPVNGIQISGFLCPDISKGTYPADIAAQLQAMDYRIDVDTVRARDDIENFSEELLYAFEKRIEALWYFWRREKWDFFLTHIMETDRLHHFMWELWESGHPRWGVFFSDFYRCIDNLIGRILNETGNSTELIILSDHGFCTLKREVYLNKWLYDSGYLRFTGSDPPDALNKIHPSSRAYSLIPGRIYINLDGREKNGSVKPGLEYERMREELRNQLAQLKDPQTGEEMVEAVLTREEVWGDESKIQNLKSKINNEEGIRQQALGIRNLEPGIGNSQSGRENSGSEDQGIRHREESKIQIPIKDPPWRKSKIIRAGSGPQAEDPGFNPKSNRHSDPPVAEIQSPQRSARGGNPKSGIQGINFHLGEGDRGLSRYVDFWDPRSPAYLAPDLIIRPQNGYDFKGNLWYPHLTAKGPVNGTHTYNDAFFLSTNLNLPAGEISISDCFEAILGFFG